MAVDLLEVLLDGARHVTGGRAHGPGRRRRSSGTSAGELEMVSGEETRCWRSGPERTVSSASCTRWPTSTGRWPPGAPMDTRPGPAGRRVQPRSPARRGVPAPCAEARLPPELRRSRGVGSGRRGHIRESRPFDPDGGPWLKRQQPRPHFGPITSAMVRDPQPFGYLRSRNARPPADWPRRRQAGQLV